MSAKSMTIPFLQGSFDDALHPVGMTVGYSAFRMAGQGMGAVDMVDDADFHVRPQHSTAELRA